MNFRLKIFVHFDTKSYQFPRDQHFGADSSFFSESLIFLIASFWREFQIFRREAEKNLKLSPLDPNLQAQFPSQIHENLASQSVISI